MADPVRLNVRENVGMALRFVRGHARFVVFVALAASVAAIFTTLLAALAPPLALLIQVAAMLAAATAYAALTAAALSSEQAALKNLAPNGFRVWSALVIVGFLLGIIMLVLGIVVMTIAFAPYSDQLAAASGSTGQLGETMTPAQEAATQTAMNSILEQNPASFLVAFFTLAVVWLLLTSRLYLVAPASLAAGRIVSLETWAWTKGQVLRILWARLMLLLPANVLVGALVLLLARLFGINLMTPDGLAVLAQANPGAALAWFFLANTIIVAIYSSLEAGLSAALYRSLRPQSALSGAYSAASTDSGRVG